MKWYHVVCVAIVCMLFMAGTLCIIGCNSNNSNNRPMTRSTSGVEKASVKLNLGPSGMTVEQSNIAERLKNDNIPGAIKHLYIISPYSGEVIMYSTVKGKVTSGGKRLTPKTVATDAGSWERFAGIPIELGTIVRHTSEVMEDDGTYGNSSDYIYWWDSKGIYHQHMITGGQIIHVSDAPLNVSRVSIRIGE